MRQALWARPGSSIAGLRWGALLPTLRPDEDFRRLRAAIPGRSAQRLIHLQRPHKHGLPSSASSQRPSGAPPNCRRRSRPRRRGSACSAWRFPPVPLSWRYSALVDVERPEMPRKRSRGPAGPAAAQHPHLHAAEPVLRERPLRPGCLGPVRQGGGPGRAGALDLQVGGREHRVPARLHRREDLGLGCLADPQGRVPRLYAPGDRLLPGALDPRPLRRAAMPSGSSP